MAKASFHPDMMPGAPTKRRRKGNVAANLDAASDPEVYPDTPSTLARDAATYAASVQPPAFGGEFGQARGFKFFERDNSPQFLGGGSGPYR